MSAPERGARYSLHFEHSSVVPSLVATHAAVTTTAVKDKFAKALLHVPRLCATQTSPRSSGLGTLRGDG